MLIVTRHGKKWSLVFFFFFLNHGPWIMKKCLLAGTDLSLNSRFPSHFRISGGEIVLFFFFFLEDHQIFQMCRGVRRLSIQFTPLQGEKGKGISDARKKWQTGKLTHAWAPDDPLVTIGEEEQTLLLSSREHWSDWFLNHCDVRHVYTLSWSDRTMMAVWILPCGKAICPSMSHHP